MPESRFQNGDRPATRRDLSYERKITDDKFALLDVHLAAIREDVEAIRGSLSMGPRWMGARVNAIIDKVLPTLIALAGLWILKGRF